MRTYRTEILNLDDPEVVNMLPARTSAVILRYRATMTAAFAHAGPTLIDVSVDSSGYGDQLVALRG